ncbi:hypothetical protein IFR05_007779 [Cadophora sp. M221]|nr:hypothetical protein IFR05_007779 [Cadophora sp. M221]
MVSDMKGKAQMSPEFEEALATQQTQSYSSLTNQNSAYNSPQIEPLGSYIIQLSVGTNVSTAFSSQLPSNQGLDNSYTGSGISGDNNNNSFVPLVAVQRASGNSNLPVKGNYPYQEENTSFKEFGLQTGSKKVEEDLNVVGNTPSAENENETLGQGGEIMDTIPKATPSTTTNNTDTYTSEEAYVVPPIYRSSLSPTWVDLADASKKGFGVGHTPCHDDLVFMDWDGQRDFQRRVYELQRTRGIAIGSLGNNQIKRRLRLFAFERSKSKSSHDLGLKSFLESRRAAKEFEELQARRREFLADSTEDVPESADTVEGSVSRRTWSRVVGSQL